MRAGICFLGLLTSQAWLDRGGLAGSRLCLGDMAPLMRSDAAAGSASRKSAVYLGADAPAKTCVGVSTVDDGRVCGYVKSSSISSVIQSCGTRA